MTRWDLSHSPEPVATQSSGELEAEPLSLTERYQFFVQFATLFASGCPILESLESIDAGQNSPNVKHVAKSMASAIQSGSTISESMHKQGSSFARTEVGLVKMGEKTGRLGHVLDKIQKNLKNQKQNRQELIQACLYPAVTFVFALGIVGLMAFVLLPRLLPVFHSFQAELPWPTRLVVYFAGAWSWLLLAVLVLGLAIVVYLREREIPPGVLHSLPVIGGALKTRAVGEATASLSVLLAAGATLDSAFGLLREQAGSGDLGDAFKDVRLRLRRGEPLVEALEVQDALPRLLIHLLAVGAEVGRLDFFSEQASVIFLDDFHYRTQRVVQLLEPLLLAFLGVFVGFLLMACFLPFYNLLTVTL